MSDIKIPKFIKWAGGKMQLIDQFIPLFPSEFKRYFEPFVGSGAVFFYIIQKYKPQEVLLSDINKELINAYEIIRDDHERLLVELKQHKEYHAADAKKYYYEIREVNPDDLPKLERCARFIYLNRTCFNGLYRVNSKGKFNVPIGSYKNPDIMQKENITFASKLLQKVKLRVMSFEKIVELAEENDFIYFDPPYYPLKKGRSFTTYTKNNFLEDEQRQLSDVFDKLTEKGCLCMESNSSTDFIKNLYLKFNTHTVKAKRLINSKKEGRGRIDEFVITNY